MSLSVLYLCVFEALVFEWSSCTRLKGINHVPRCSFLVKTWLTQNLTCFLVSGQRKCDETWDVIHLSLTLEEIHRSNFEHARQWVDFLSVRSVVRSSYLYSSGVCSDNELCVWLIQRTLKSSSHSDHPDLLNDMGLDLLSSPSTTLIEGHRASLNDFDFLVLVSGFDFLILGDGLGFTGDFVNSFFLFTLLLLSSNEM